MEPIPGHQGHETSKQRCPAGLIHGPGLDLRREGRRQQLITSTGKVITGVDELPGRQQRMTPRDQVLGDADIYESSEDGQPTGRLRLDGTGASLSRCYSFCPLCQKGTVK